MARTEQDEQPWLIKPIRTPKEAFRTIRNYLAGQFVGATRDDSLLDEVMKCLFCKLYVEQGLADSFPEKQDSFQRANHARAIFAQVRKDFPDIYPANTEVLLDPQAMNVVFDECSFSLIDANSDPIGDAFEVFVGSESRGRAGQFFTPRMVTDFLVEAVDPQPGELVIDPACGAGGFLTSVVRHYLAKGVKMKELGALSANTLFGMDKDDYLTKLAKLHIALLTRGHPRVQCADTIAMENGTANLRNELPKNGFDVLLTNPPFGTRIVAARPEVLRTFELARRWIQHPITKRLEPSTEVLSQVSPQVLFVERCLSLLRPGGRLGMVLPESVLSNKSYRYVMEYLLRNADVEAVIGMPEALFKTSGKGGTHTKTCLLVATKLDPATKRTKTVFMAEAKWCGHDSRARNIPHNDLPKIAERLRASKRSAPLSPSPLGFVLRRKEISSNVLCPRYYDPETTAALESIRSSHELLVFGELAKEGVLAVSTGDELGKLAYGTGTIPFIRTSDLSNWELKSDAKHGIDRKIYESLRTKQDVRSNDLLMVKDGTYLIGTCAIVTKQDEEIVFQSHLYKIRVQSNTYGLNPFLMLAVLSAPIVQRQIRSKQFCQDIIDSLGERINELVLPIPKSEKLRDEITDMVKRAVRQRIVARDLAREARLKIVALPALNEKAG